MKWVAGSGASSRRPGTFAPAAVHCSGRSTYVSRCCKGLTSHLRRADARLSHRAAKPGNYLGCVESSEPTDARNIQIPAINAAKPSAERSVHVADSEIRNFFSEPFDPVAEFDFSDDLSSSEIDWSRARRNSSLPFPEPDSAELDDLPPGRETPSASLSGGGNGASDEDVASVSFQFIEPSWTANFVSFDGAAALSPVDPCTRRADARLPTVDASYAVIEISRSDFRRSSGWWTDRNSAPVFVSGEDADFKFFAERHWMAETCPMTGCLMLDTGAVLVSLISGSSTGGRRLRRRMPPEVVCSSFDTLNLSSISEEAFVTSGATHARLK